MLSTRDVILKAKSLIPAYKAGEEQAKGSLEMIAEITEIPLDCLVAVLDIDEGDKDGEQKADPKELAALREKLEAAEEKISALIKERDGALEKAKTAEEKCTSQSKVMDKAVAQRDKLETQCAALTERVQDQANRITVLEHIRDKKQEKDTRQQLLDPGKEKEKYEGEILAFVLEAIEAQLRNSTEDTRRYHVLKDILDNNKMPEGLKKHRDAVQQIMTSDLTNYGEQMSNELARIDITYEKGKKHAKLYLAGDSRYMVTMSITPSRRDSNTELLKDINRVMF